MKRTLDLRTLSPKTFYIASGLVAVLGAGATYTAYTGLSTAETRVAALRGEARDEKDVKAELAKTQTQIEELRTKLRHLEEGVPSFAYIPTMTRELETVGRSHGIEVLGIRPMPAPATAKKDDGEAKTKPAYEELTIAVKGRGDYGSVMRFVQALTRFPKIVEVRMLTLEPKIDTKNPLARPLLDADIEMRAYAFKDAEPAAKITTARAPREGQRRVAAATERGPRDAS